MIIRIYIYMHIYIHYINSTNIRSESIHWVLLQLSRFQFEFFGTVTTSWPQTSLGQHETMDNDGSMPVKARTKSGPR